MTEYEIWIGGYAVTGQSSGAERLLRIGETNSKWEGDTFKQACVKALNELNWPLLYEALQGLGSCYYDPKNNSYWGRTFYDNETDARKSFG